jgi:hypothetical protein
MKDAICSAARARSFIGENLAEEAQREWSEKARRQGGTAGGTSASKGALGYDVNGYLMIIS